MPVLRRERCGSIRIQAAVLTACGNGNSSNVQRREDVAEEPCRNCNRGNLLRNACNGHGYHAGPLNDTTQRLGEKKVTQ